ncbi:MAG: HNH endonuclease [Clostridiales bacterium]|nr:HNH endonuclease [Clostridiales bacterium]
MRERLQTFYKSKAWQKCRDAYVSSVGGLCERCKTRGLIVAGEIVHHKVHLNVYNIDDESITLNWDNLELLCRKCHGDEHKRTDKRYSVDDNGHVIILSDDLPDDRSLSENSIPGQPLVQ